MSKTNNGKSLVSRVLSGLRWSSIAALVAGCLAEQFPAPKEWEQKAQRSHSESIVSEQDKNLYKLIGFTQKNIVASNKGRNQTIARIDEFHEIPHLPVGYEGGILATIVEETLHCTLDGDIRSWLEVYYNPVTNELQFVEYAVENGMVKTPLPAGYKPQIYSGNLLPGEVCLLDKFFKENFGASIFPEINVIVDEYLVNPDAVLIKLNKYIEEINTTKTYKIESGKRKGEERTSFEKCTFERAKLLEEAARRYKKISLAAPGEKVAEREKILGRLEGIYSQMEEKSRTGVPSPNPKYGDYSRQLEQIEENLDRIKQILEIK